MKVYLAGPMTGLDAFNFPAFHAAAAELRGRGWEVVNPAELTTDTTLSWHECMRRALAGLVQCDEVYVMPGWKNSRGAKIEVWLAERLCMPVWDLETGVSVVAVEVR